VRRAHLNRKVTDIRTELQNVAGPAAKIEPPLENLRLIPKLLTEPVKPLSDEGVGPNEIYSRVVDQGKNVDLTRDATMTR
jgi:hypothetical protein